MTKVEHSVVINRPIEEVFSYVTDIGNWPQWNSGMLEGEHTSEGSMAVGTTFRGGDLLQWSA